MRRAFLLGGLICGLASQTGCVSASGAQVREARRAVQARDAQIAVMRQQMQHMSQLLQSQASVLHAREVQLRQAVQSAPSAKVQVQKLEQLIALNEKMAERLAQTEQALRKLQGEKASADGHEPAEVALAATELDQQLDQEVFALQFEESLANIHALEVSAAARTAAYKRLLRQVQYLVDTGRVHAVRLKDGRVKFRLPRKMDKIDPWAPEGEPESD